VGEGGERSEPGEGSCLSAHIIGRLKNAFMVMPGACVDAEPMLKSRCGSCCVIAGY
jgi:hypothetical protein